MAMTAEQQEKLAQLEANYTSIKNSIAEKNNAIKTLVDKGNALNTQLNEVNNWLTLVNQGLPTPPILNLPAYAPGKVPVQNIQLIATVQSKLNSDINSNNAALESLKNELTRLQEQEQEALEAIQKYKLTTLTPSELSDYQETINSASNTQTKSKLTIYIIIGVVGSIVLVGLGWVIYKYVGKSKVA
jgi:chromosome segregation ATPase